MPPKVRILKQDVVDVAIEIVRKEGADALNARTIAAALGCSTQPVFSNFASMEELKKAVIAEAETLYEAYAKRETEKGEYPPYKANGMAYIRFAKEEKELFKLLYMRSRSAEEAASSTGLLEQMTDLVHQNTGLSGDHALFFHLKIWACVHGIATMFATGYLDLEWTLVSQIITDTYQGLKKQNEKE
jgi:AcrR family transcriptional regulator